MRYEYEYEDIVGMSDNDNVTSKTDVKEAA